MKRRFKFRDDDGKMKYLDKNNIAISPIKNAILNDNILRRIKAVYDDIRDVIIHEVKDINCLEQFEIQFMRTEDLEQNISVYENIAKTYKIAQKSMGNDFETRCTIFRIIMFHVLDAFTEEEKEREDIQFIRKLCKRIMDKKKNDE